jgi:hypothetical protein
VGRGRRPPAALERGRAARLHGPAVLGAEGGHRPGRSLERARARQPLARLAAAGSRAGKRRAALRGRGRGAHRHRPLRAPRRVRRARADRRHGGRRDPLSAGTGRERGAEAAPDARRPAKARPIRRRLVGTALAPPSPGGRDGRGGAAPEADGRPARSPRAGRAPGPAARELAGDRLPAVDGRGDRRTAQRSQGRQGEPTGNGDARPSGGDRGLAHRAGPGSGSARP